MSEPQQELSEKDRDLAARLAANPLDMFQGKSLGWLEDFIRITVGNTAGLNGRWITGDVKIISQDLTAQTGVYEYEDESGLWLFQNGADADQDTYADLYAFYGPNKFAADSGGNFTLADTRGRVMALCGTHADAGLGDNDGVVVASRTMKHSHTNGVTVGLGTLAASAHSVTDPGHRHALPYQDSGTAGGTRAFMDGNATTATDTGHMSDATTGITVAAHTFSGSLAVGGTIGGGTPVDMPAHIFIGSALVRI